MHTQACQTQCMNIYTMFVNGWRIGMPSPSYDRIRLGKGQALFATTSEPASRRRAFNQAAVFERGRAKPASETGKVTAQTLIEHWLHTLIQWLVLVWFEPQRSHVMTAQANDTVTLQLTRICTQWHVDIASLTEPASAHCTHYHHSW